MLWRVRVYKDKRDTEKTGLFLHEFKIPARSMHEAKVQCKGFSGYIETVHLTNRELTYKLGDLFDALGWCWWSVFREGFNATTTLEDAYDFANFMYENAHELGYSDYEGHLYPFVSLPKRAAIKLAKDVIECKARVENIPITEVKHYFQLKDK